MINVVDFIKQKVYNINVVDKQQHKGERKMEIKVGDIVRFKTVEQLKKEGWYEVEMYGQSFMQHDDTQIVINESMMKNYMGKEYKVKRTYELSGESRLRVEHDTEDWSFTYEMVDCVVPQPKFKVGDKVRLKSLDEILRDHDKYSLEDKDLVYDDGTALWEDEIKYCGQEFEVSHISARENLANIEREGIELFGVPSDILEPIQESNANLFDLNQAVAKLINGECDAIRYHENISICAYRDKDTGVFKVAKYRGEGKLLIYTDEPFFMHEDYILNSKWELVVDNAKHEQIKRHKQRLIATLDSLYLLDGIEHETYTSIMDKVESI